jgi:hypothetical protein
MVHIVEHHDFMPEDFMVEEAAISSTPRVTNLPAPSAAVVVHSAGCTLPRKRPGRLGLRLERCLWPENYCTTLLAPRPRRGP